MEVLQKGAGCGPLDKRPLLDKCISNPELSDLCRNTGTTPLCREAHSVCCPVFIHAKRHRPPNPWSAQDGALLEAISRCEFALNGLRNRDLQKLFYPGKHQPPQRRGNLLLSLVS